MSHRRTQAFEQLVLPPDPVMDLATRPGPNMPHKRGARKPLRKSTKAQGLANDRCQRFGELERGVPLACAPPPRAAELCQRFGELEHGVTRSGHPRHTPSRSANASESWNTGAPFPCGEFEA